MLKPTACGAKPAASGLTPTRAQCAADAFERLFEGKGIGTGRTDLVFVYDLDAYARGHAHPGEVAQILGGGPLPVSIVRPTRGATRS